MSCLGVHFALDAEEVLRLRAHDNGSDRLDWFHEEIEERFFSELPHWCAESNKAWDAIHRALTSGGIEWENGTSPFNHVILGGESLYSGDDYIMSLKTPSQVREIATALRGVTEAGFHSAYFRIDPSEYDGSLGEDDFACTWEYFQEVRDLFARAAQADRFVLFTASQ